MKIIAIDPGTTQSALVHYEDGQILGKWLEPNEKILEYLKTYFATSHLAIEYFANYGMPIGETSIRTIWWIGRFVEAWGGDYTEVLRKDVKMNLCYSMKAKDSNIRQAIIDRYPASGGGKTPQIGIKSNKGPLFGFSKDLWQSLAVAITYEKMKKQEEENASE